MIKIVAFETKRFQSSQLCWHCYNNPPTSRHNPIINKGEKQKTMGGITKPRRGKKRGLTKPLTKKFLFVQYKKSRNKSWREVPPTKVGPICTSISFMVNVTNNENHRLGHGYNIIF